MRVKACAKICCFLAIDVNRHTIHVLIIRVHGLCTDIWEGMGALYAREV